MRSAASRAPTAVVPISGTRAGEPSQRHVDILARTKLRPPRLSDRLVDRGPLLDTLEKTVANTAVTLLVAPAGFGKTTTMAALARRFANSRAAWASLDRDDADRWRFLTVLTEALRSADASCGTAAATLLADSVGPAPNPRRLLDLIVNDVLTSRSEPLFLFLDDLQEIAGEALDDLAYLAEHAPPQLRLVIASRSEPDLPVARWRARRAAVVLRPTELGFSADETRRFFNEVLDLGLGPDEAAGLHDLTQGWPAAVTLVAESLSREGGSRSFLDGYADPIDHSVFDFLSQEVVDGLEPEEQEFVTAVAVLDELTPAACAALTGREDAARLLEGLERRNLFILALDGATPVLRFHELFRAALLRRLEREGTARLRDAHRRAAAVAVSPEAVVRHLLAAEAWEEAADTIAARGPELLRRGLNRSVRGWIESLPVAVVTTRPRLDLLLGIEAWSRWDLDRARTHLEHAVEAFDRAGDAAGRGRALVFLSHAVHTAGETRRARSMMDAARCCPLDPATRMRLHVQEAWYALSTGRADEVVGLLDAALDLAEASPDSAVIHSLADTIHCHFVGIPGVIDRLERFGRLAEPHCRQGDSPLKASVLRLMAWAHQWRGRTELAEATATEALAISDRLGDLPCVILDSGVGHAACMSMAGRHVEAETYLGRISEVLSRPELVPFAEAWLSVYLVAIGRIRLLQGRLDEARRIAVRMQLVRGPREWPAAPVARTLMAGRLALAEHRWADAEASLSQAAELQRSIRLFGYCDDARLLLARLLLDRKRPDEALERVEPALAEAEADRTPGGITWHGREALVPILRLAWDHGLHRDLVAGLLADLGYDPERPRSAPIRVSSTGETLTERELEVLGLIARGHSNAAIAEALYLSVHTVKRHVANVLRKLDCPSRTAASAGARDLGIL